MTLYQFEFSLSAAITKSYKCAQQDIQKFVGNSLPNAPPPIRLKQKNSQEVEEENYQNKSN